MATIEINALPPPARMSLWCLFLAGQLKVVADQLSVDLRNLSDGVLRAEGDVTPPGLDALSTHCAALVVHNPAVVHQAPAIAIVHLLAVDAWFQAECLYRDHIYTEDQVELLDLMQSTSCLPGTAAEEGLRLLASTGLVYRFYLAKQFECLGSGKYQLRLCGWGRYYAESVLLRAPGVAHLYRAIAASLDAKLRPCAQSYKAYIANLQSGGPDPTGLDLRSVLPYKIVI